jgi:hypothetical protein
MKRRSGRWQAPLALAAWLGVGGCGAGETGANGRADAVGAPADSPALRLPAYNPDEPHPPAGIGPELRVDTVVRPPGGGQHP